MSAQNLHRLHRVDSNRIRFTTLLFDVDGTLIDSNGAHAVAWTTALQEHGIDAGLGHIRRLIGIFTSLLPSLQPTPGARPLLEFLRERQVDLVVATSADDREMSALLQRAGVADLIPARTSKDSAPASKPDPDIVRAALARSWAHPKYTALIGDTPYDIEAAERAGTDAIALRCGGYWTDTSLRGAAQIFDNPQALLAYWRKS